MTEALIRKVKLFWAWQDEKEEQWLGELSRQGLHLRQAGLFGRYLFSQGEPREYAYRLDFVTSANKNPDYYQLFQDAGWTHVGEMSGWQYWRKEILDGKEPEIYTDNVSKIHKYQRLIAVLVIFSPITFLPLMQYSRWSDMTGEQGFFSILYGIGSLLFFTLTIVFSFSLFKIIQRISQLKNP